MSDFTMKAVLEGQDVSLSSTVKNASKEFRNLDQATREASASQKQAQSTLAGVSKKAGDVSSSLRPVAIALAGIGVASTAMQSKFETTFAKTVGLAGLAADQVGKVEDATKKLAVATGQSPQDLAEGYYFISSAGVTGAKALETLEAAAKGATAGLGTTSVVADAATSAINAYGAENMTAARAVDVLAETAKQGKAEAADLAPQFGRLLPIAAQLGISFEEVGGGLAYLTRNSGNAHLATTQLSGVMRKLLDPSQQARDLLGTFGITADDLRKKIGTEGLQKTLLDLYATFGGNTDAISTFFDDVDALNGVLSLTGKNADSAGEVFDALKNSTGSAGAAFDSVAKTDAFRMQQGLAKVKVAALDVGESLLPLAANAANFIGGAASGFASLPGPVRTTAEVIGGATIAAYGLAKGVETAAKATEALSKVAGSGATAVGALGAAAVGLTVLGLAYAEVTAKSGDLKRSTDDYTESLRDQTKAVDELSGSFIAKSLADKGKLGNLGAIGLTTKDFSKGATGNNKEFVDLANQIRDLDKTMNGSSKNADALISSLFEMRAAAAQSAAGVANAALTNEKLGRSAIETAAAAKLPADEFASLQRILADGVVTSQELATSNLDLTDVLSILRSISGDSAGAIGGLGSASDGTAGAMVGASLAAQGLTGALSGLADAYSALQGSNISFERSQLEAGKATKAVADAQEAVRTGGKSLEKQQRSGGSAADSAAQSQKRVEDALRGVENAQRRVADAKRSIADAEERQVEAERDRAQRVSDLTDAYQHLYDVQYGRNDSKGSQDAARDVKKGERDQIQSQLDLERARIRAQQAQDAYDKLSADSGTTAEDLASADLDRRDAALAVLDAQDRVTDAEDNLTEARRKLSGETKGYAEGSKELKEAQEGVKKSNDDLKDADKKVSDAHRDLEDRNRDLEDSLRGVDDAERGVIDAQTQRVAGSGGYSATVKTQKELEDDLKDALLTQKDAYRKVGDDAKQAAEDQQAYADKLSGHVTPEAELNALKTDAQRRALEQLRDGLAPDSPLLQWLDEYIAKLKETPEEIKTQIQLELTAKGLAGIGGGALDLIAPEDLAKLMAPTAKPRAKGGPVVAGASYLVGENQPEIYTPSVSGYIYPSVAAGYASGGDGAFGATTINLGGLTVNGNVITEGELLDFIETGIRRRMKAKR